MMVKRQIDAICEGLTSSGQTGMLYNASIIRTVADVEASSFNLLWWISYGSDFRRRLLQMLWTPLQLFVAVSGW